MRWPLPRPDRPLLRVRGNFFSDNSAMPTIHIQISSIISLAIVNNYYKVRKFTTNSKRKG